MVPSPLRSACSCRSSKAYGFTVFPVKGTDGGKLARAKPSWSHSLVTPCQVPALSSYSTRNHPLLSGQAVAGSPAAPLHGSAAAAGLVVQATSPLVVSAQAVPVKPPAAPVTEKPPAG